jgi:myosin heavy subunit
MARRGLVSKSTGGPQAGGSAGLMSKGEKPKGPELLPVVEVARRLRVEPGQVETWMQKSQLRGSDAGIRPYDFKKFQLDHADEIRRAQKEALQDKQTKSDRKPKKGFLSKFAAIFGGGKSSDDGANQLAQENKLLKQELTKLKKSKPDNKSSSKDDEEKVRYLEKKASEAKALEIEVAKLKQRIKDQPVPTAAVSEPNEDLVRELEQARYELAQAQQASAEQERFREALSDVQREKAQLQAALTELQASSAEPNTDSQQLEHLRAALQSREKALVELQARAHEMVEENERLRSEAEAVPVLPQDNPLADELLELQRLNLERFKRVQALYQSAAEELAKLQAAPLDQAAATEEFLELQQKYKKLLTQQSSKNPAHQEVMEQLSNSRVTVAKLQEENGRLRGQLSNSDQKAAEKRILELEEKLRQADSKSGSYRLVESELSALKKSVQLKENQLQKVTSRLADNEKRLAKALQESARLTDLLIERENRLRELSKEFEQEYRDKMENLDRQVSGLQWKLSLREERIAHLESELLRKGE